MLLDDLIEHRCPDLVVPQHRAGQFNASMADQTQEPRRVQMLWVNDKARASAETTKIKGLLTMIQLLHAGVLLLQKTCVSLDNNG